MRPEAIAALDAVILQGIDGNRSVEHRRQALSEFADETNSGHSQSGTAYQDREKCYFL
jgi:hypothetical protein